MVAQRIKAITTKQSSSSHPKQKTQQFGMVTGVQTCALPISTRDECLSPRVRLECNPEIPVAPGEDHWLLDTSLDDICKFTVHVLLQHGLENFEHSFASV